MEQRKTTVLELEDTNKQALEIVMELLGDDYSMVDIVEKIATKY